MTEMTLQQINKAIREAKKERAAIVAAQNAMPVEDKAYFDRRIYHSTGTFQTKLDKETRVPVDGTSKWVTVDPAQYITPRRVRISGIKGEIEIAAQLSGDEIKGISAKAVKATAARQGVKTKFYLDPSNISLILKQEENENRKVLQLVKQKQASGKKSDLMDATNLAHGMAYSNATANTIQDLRKILKSKNPADKQAAQQALSKIEAIESFWQAKHTELQNQYRAAHSRAGTKTKFANRGAFAEASSSPVLGSLLEKKVMPEGGWRAVETDGGALVIAFEDNDIAGNFARRAAENGYSATAPMAMAGRFWNVKVQNENKQ